MKLKTIKHCLYHHPTLLGLVFGGTLLLGLLLQGILLDRFPVILGNIERLAVARDIV